MKDPIVEEVRKYRMEHTRKFQGNLSAICADLRSIQLASGHNVVRLSPKNAIIKNRLDNTENSGLSGISVTPPLLTVAAYQHNLKQELRHAFTGFDDYRRID